MYDFKSLSSYDFELLVRDLLQKELGVVFESFKSGRDKGIDLRYAIDKEKNIIVQCKHYAGTGVSGLLGSLKKEIEKVKKLNPARYIIATSVGLTPNNKEEILGMFHPYCKNTGDILGNDELNNLLNIHQDVERSHYKLWLTSSNILSRIIHSGVYNQTKMLMEEIQEKAKYYVQNRSFLEAVEILSEHNYCIISGIPGIGKTFLAEVLLLEFAGREFEPIVVTSHINEAFETLDTTRKQIFYYDDFLGQTGWEERLEKNEEQRILKFIKYAEQHNQTKFVLTTREYILQQSKNIYERLNAVEFEYAKCIINLEDYTRLNRAHILFNHLFFSNIPKKYIQTLIIKDNLLPIIDHENYSPRIVEWMSSYVNIKEFTPAEYAIHFLNTLKNPKDLWLHAFRKHISPSARSLLIVLMTFRYSVNVKSLTRAYLAYRTEEIKIFGGSIDANEMESSLSEVEGSFVSIERDGKDLFVRYHNPSVLDFLEEYVRNNLEILRIIMDSLVYYEQFLAVVSRGRRRGQDPLLNAITKEDSQAIKRAIIETVPHVTIDKAWPLNIYTDGTFGYVPLSTIEKNIAHAIEYSVNLPPVERRGVILQLLEIAGERIAKDEASLDEIINIFEAVYKAQHSYELCEKLIELVANRIQNEAEEYEELADVLTFCKFYDIAPERIDDEIVANLSRKVQEDSELFFDDSLYNASDENDLEECRENAEHIEMSLGVDLGIIYQEIEDQLEGFGAGIYEDPNELYHPRDSASEGGSDNDILEMFDALKD